MKERPILFKTDMVRAILDGRKTQTRRVIKEFIGNGRISFYGDRCRFTPKARGLGDEMKSRDPADIEVKCPYGQPSELLWVRETFVKFIPRHWPPKYGYKADMPRKRGAWEESEQARKDLGYKWTSPRFMPREASRILLEITDIRVERVQEIDNHESWREGIPALEFWPEDMKSYNPQRHGYLEARDVFAHLWDSINAKREYSWESNPWVWVITFKKI